MPFFIRVAIKENEKGKGLDGKITKILEEKSINIGIKDMWIDTHRKNKSMQKKLDLSIVE